MSDDMSREDVYDLIKGRNPDLCEHDLWEAVDFVFEKKMFDEVKDEV